MRSRGSAPDGIARLLSVIGLFLVVSWAGLWLALPFVARAAGIALFVLLALGALFPLTRFRWPTREEGLSRLDRGTGIRHRPATALTDTLASKDPIAQALWRGGERTLASIKRIRAGLPSPRLAIHDPGRCAGVEVMVMVAAAYVAAGDERRMRVAAAFDWNGVLAPANVRVDAWVTPPVYTGKPPVILSAANRDAASPDSGPLQVPAGSTLMIERRQHRRRRGRRPRRDRPERTGAQGYQRAPVQDRRRRHRARPRAVRPAAMAVRRHGQTVRRSSRWPRIRNVRPAARCRCPTGSRTITASPKTHTRFAARAGDVDQIYRQGSCKGQQGCGTAPAVRAASGTCRWCCPMHAPATASARP